MSDQKPTTRVDSHAIEDGLFGSKADSTHFTESLLNATAVQPAIQSLSGLYTWSDQQVREELRLDVDGRYPQMVASGTTISNFNAAVHWIAKLSADGPNRWAGIIKNYGNPTFPYTNVQIEAAASAFPDQGTATAVFFAGNQSDRTISYRFESPYFHRVQFEFDAEEGTTPATTFHTHSLDNRPATLPNETLTISDVFKRAGFDVSISEGGSTIPREDAGADTKWTFQELNDAMHAHWSHYSDKPNWSLWTFFAASESREYGRSLGGVMFDSSGANQRQGTAVFNNSFIAEPPPGSPNPAAWVQRMRFWCAIHEMGHSFNLAHSWQKHLGSPWAPPDGPLRSEPAALSFMNYPYKAEVGGLVPFFNRFEYRFSDQELLFMRHAPERFVQMGNTDWFVDHGARGAYDAGCSHSGGQLNAVHHDAFRLEVRVNRDTPLYEWMEPVVAELKLTNTSDQPQLVKNDLLSDLSGMTVVVRREGEQGKRLLPHAQYCRKLEHKILLAGESLYDSIFASVGNHGWLIAEPGFYTIQVVLSIEGKSVVSNVLKIRVAPPTGYDQQYIAQDYFSDEVGRILAFDGSRYLEKGNDILREVTEKLSDRAVALHAHIALAKPLAFDYKLLDYTGDADTLTARGGQIKRLPAQPDEARKQFDAALTQQRKLAATTLTHIDYNDYMRTYSKFLATQGEEQSAAEVQSVLYQTLAERSVREPVLQEIEHRRMRYEQV
ncbi:hypothetical protein [Paenibacillus sp. 481]|uniref:hypothetical protein n=1 Tax=Paenibacillus sp. 481 TaxID=2835869 RepID=UPI001E5248B1|nr:hypothetical protein [Paenibacillus sp. 481]UHA73775.1 hypothetical protein KIK04_00965 [Paenibacillus sp. 481]